jgi:hypothetical protein
VSRDSMFLCYTLREEHRLSVFENRVLRRTFGPKGEEVVGGWRRLHNEELHNLHTSPNQLGRMGGTCCTHG